MLAKQFILLLLFCLAFRTANAQDRAVLPVPQQHRDSVVTFASDLYEPNSFLRRVLMGNNYREEWKQYVTLPVFRFSASGFRIEELGGGMQTKSLHLLDRHGKEWALRTVDKDVSEALPPGVRRTLVRRASQDFISASFPYGAPIAGELVNAVGVTAARPTLFFVADDTALGEYRSLFANTICLLEERDPGFTSTDNIEEAVENITKSHAYKIQQPQLLRARLMDMIMADWDRHSDNWRWGLKDSAGLKYYYGIPRDRDWVFFQSRGILPKLMRLSGGMRCFVNFSPDIKNIKDLSWKAWTMDKNFLNELTASDWETAISVVQTLLTDSVIEASVRKMPAAIFAMEGQQFISTLKSRRDRLKQEVMKYYRFLSEEVLINGSNDEEVFQVSSVNDSLRITVYQRKQHLKIYERIFSPKETYSITINGLAGNDSFLVDSGVESKIRLILNGGEGLDSYQIKGKIRTRIMDTPAEQNLLETTGQARMRFE